jgi:hypothetical protein
VDDVIAQLKVAETKAREAADSARKAGAEASIFTALSMLIGAFIACAAAALGVTAGTNTCSISPWTLSSPDLTKLKAIEGGRLTNVTVLPRSLEMLTHE